MISNRKILPSVKPLSVGLHNAILAAGLVIGVLPMGRAEAGPLIDFLFGSRQPAAPAYPVGSPYAVANPYAVNPYAAANPYAVSPYVAGNPYAANPYAAARPTTNGLPTYGTYYGSNLPVVGQYGYGYSSQKPGPDIGATLPSNMSAPLTPVTLVPDYRSVASRTPVTYYRPVLTTDPNTGAQVVALAPCSSYEYQTNRVPTWGLSQVFNGGATLPGSQPIAPTSAPVYSLPRGGVPLAGPIAGTQPYSTAYGTYPSTSTSMMPPASTSWGSTIIPAAPTPYPTQYSAPYSNGYSTYASNYGNYSALQAPVGNVPNSTYSTTPYSGGASPYYGTGSTGGSSAGRYAPQPQMVAPTQPYGAVPPYGAAPYGAAPSSAPPYGAAPYGTPSAINPSLIPANPNSGYPGYTVPGAPGYPGAATQPINPGQPLGLPGAGPSGQFQPVMPPSADPAAGVPPTLPGSQPANLPIEPGQSSARLESKPQLQRVVQQPMPGTSATAETQPPLYQSAPATPSRNATSSDGLLPIPVPNDFKHEPRWNPGLLNEQDQTAARSKPIRWASLP